MLHKIKSGKKTEQSFLKRMAMDGGIIMDIFFEAIN
tara:strand:- start:437 stop:544 length:108 start_codon:yes stop_codon:yes gene_type:complete